MLAGRTVADPYSAYSPYGRHDREHRVDEVRQLVEHAGFAVESRYTADVGGPADRRQTPRAALRALTTAGLALDPGRARRLGFYTLATMRKSRDPKRTESAWPYGSYAASEID